MKGWLDRLGRGTRGSGRLSRARRALYLAVTPAVVLLGLTTQVGTVSAASTPVLAYDAVSPCRILDTRTASPLAAGDTMNVLVAPTAGTVHCADGSTRTVPAGSQAAVINATVTGSTKYGYLSLYPVGGAASVSNLNFATGETVANLTTVGLAAMTDGSGITVKDGQPSGTVQVVLDLEGFYAAVSSSAGQYVPMTPVRIADTRATSGSTYAGQTLQPGGTLNVQVTGAGGIPASGVSAVVFNLTVANGTSGSYLTAFPAGATRPTASNLNFAAGEIVPNRVIVPVGTGGQVSIYNDLGTVDVIVDADGYYTDSTAAAGAGSLFTPLATPQRIVDTRLGSGSSYAGDTLGPGRTLNITTAGVGAISSRATAVAENVTAADGTAGSLFTVYPTGVTRPTASDLNFSAHEIVPNMVQATLGGGAQTIYNAQGSADAIVDVFGYFVGYSVTLLPAAQGNGGGSPYVDRFSNGAYYNPANTNGAPSEFGTASDHLPARSEFKVAALVLDQAGQPYSGNTGYAVNWTLTNTGSGGTTVYLDAVGSYDALYCASGSAAPSCTDTLGTTSLFPNPDNAGSSNGTLPSGTSLAIKGGGTLSFTTYTTNASTYHPMGCIGYRSNACPIFDDQFSAIAVDSADAAMLTVSAQIAPESSAATEGATMGSAQSVSLGWAAQPAAAANATGTIVAYDPVESSETEASGTPSYPGSDVMIVDTASGPEFVQFDLSGVTNTYLFSTSTVTEAQFEASQAAGATYTMVNYATSTQVNQTSPGGGAGVELLPAAQGSGHGSPYADRFTDGTYYNPTNSNGSPGEFGTASDSTPARSEFKVAALVVDQAGQPYSGATGYAVNWTLTNTGSGSTTVYLDAVGSYDTLYCASGSTASSCTTTLGTASLFPNPDQAGSPSNGTLPIGTSLAIAGGSTLTFTTYTTSGSAGPHPMGCIGNGSCPIYDSQFSAIAVDSADTTDLSVSAQIADESMAGTEGSTIGASKSVTLGWAPQPGATADATGTIMTYDPVEGTGTEAGGNTSYPGSDVIIVDTPNGPEFVQFDLSGVTNTYEVSGATATEDQFEAAQVAGATYAMTEYAMTPQDNQIG